MSNILIIEACFYQDIATLLREGAIDVLNKQGQGYEIETVPGALEIPAALNFFYPARKNTMPMSFWDALFAAKLPITILYVMKARGAFMIWF